MTLAPLFQQANELAAIAQSRHSASTKELYAEVTKLRRELAARGKRTAELSRQLDESCEREQQARDEAAALRDQLGKERSEAARSLRRHVQEGQKREQALDQALLTKTAEDGKLSEKLARATAQLKQRGAELVSAQGQLRLLRHKLDAIELSSQQHEFIGRAAAGACAGSAGASKIASRSSSPASKRRAGGAKASDDASQSHQMQPCAPGDSANAFDETVGIEKQQQEFISRLLHWAR